MIVGCVCNEFQEEVVRNFDGVEDRCRPCCGVPRQIVSVVVGVEHVGTNEMGNGGLRAAALADGACGLSVEQSRGDPVDVCGSSLPVASRRLMRRPGCRLLVQEGCTRP